MMDYVFLHPIQGAKAIPDVMQRDQYTTKARFQPSFMHALA